MSSMSSREGMRELADFYGEPVFVYTRQQAIEDGCLIDVSKWASGNTGFHGGFTCPVAMTRALWEEVQAPEGGIEDTRGRAHDVLWMSSLALRRALAKNEEMAAFDVTVGGRTLNLWVVLDGDGVTIGFPGDF